MRSDPSTPGRGVDRRRGLRGRDLPLAAARARAGAIGTGARWCPGCLSEHRGGPERPGPPREAGPVVTAGGGSGIRTHGELPHTRFPSVPIRPLSHPSKGVPVGTPSGLWERRATCPSARSRVWRSGPVQSEPVNRVRAGRQQLSAGTPMCRRSPDRHTGERALSCPPPPGGSFRHAPACSIEPRGVEDGEHWLVSACPAC